MDLEAIISRAKEGDLEAFAEATRRFQFYFTGGIDEVRARAAAR